MTRSACVICERPCVAPRRTYCSATCAAVLYAPKGERTVLDQVKRDLFLARETFARMEPKSHELEVRIQWLSSWLGELERNGSGRTQAYPSRPVAYVETTQLALPEVA